MSRAGFNSTERAKARESDPVILGEAKYFPARLTNKRLREVRAESRRGQSEARAAGKKTDEYRKALKDAKDDGLEDKEAREEAEQAAANTDEYSDVIDSSLARQFAMLLVDEAVQHPSEETMLAHINGDVDTRDLDALMGYLVGPDEDPTTTPTGPTAN